MAKIINILLFCSFVLGNSLLYAAEYIIAGGVCFSTYLMVSRRRSLCAAHKPSVKPVNRSMKVDDVGRTPIFYRPEYNLFLLGKLLDSWLHSFDGGKFGTVATHLQDKFCINFRQPEMVANEDLQLVHTAGYLNSLSKGSTIASILEALPLKWLPVWFLTKRILNPMRYATQGTIEAVEAAVVRGWAINLGGGYHHAKSSQGEGFCVYADIPIAIAKLHQKYPSTKVLIVDTDAHLGNGHGQFKSWFKHGRRKQWVYIFDMYNRDKYPCDRDGACDFGWYVDYACGLQNGVSTGAYLKILKDKLPRALDEVEPGLIIYNAGTDILAGDPLGGMDVSEEGIIERDCFVFNEAFQRNIPIVITLSGGYTKASAGVIGKSIANILSTHHLVLLK